MSLNLPREIEQLAERNSSDAALEAVLLDGLEGDSEEWNLAAARTFE
jgi:hypothetical protein